MGKIFKRTIIGTYSINLVRIALILMAGIYVWSMISLILQKPSFSNDLWWFSYLCFFGFTFFGLYAEQKNEKIGWCMLAISYLSYSLIKARGFVGREIALGMIGASLLLVILAGINFRTFYKKCESEIDKQIPRKIKAWVILLSILLGFTLTIFVAWLLRMR